MPVSSPGILALIFFSSSVNGNPSQKVDKFIREASVSHTARSFYINTYIRILDGFNKCAFEQAVTFSGTYHIDAFDLGIAATARI